MNQQKTVYALPFWIIWVVEFWERYGFAGLQSILVLFLIEAKGMPQNKTYLLFGTFNAFLYAFIWLGGWLGDRVLGAKRILFLGAIVLGVSYFSLAIDGMDLYIALAGIIIGNGLFKANPPSLISKIYKDNPNQLDGAMTLYYVAINMGGLLGAFLIPVISKAFGWEIAFVACSIGIAIGVVIYLLFYRRLADLNSYADLKKTNWLEVLMIVVGIAASIYGISYLLQAVFLSNIIVFMVMFCALVYFFLIFKAEDKKSKIKMIIASLLFTEAIIFFVLYNQLPSSLILFVKNNVVHNFFGYNLSPALYYLLNPLTIIVFSPIISKLYIKYPSTHATKYCIGMTLCASAFLILYFPQFFSKDGIVSNGWIVSTYFLQSVGELLISALGLPMMIALCPKRISGFICGFWFLNAMLAGPISGWIGQFVVVSDKTNPIESMHIYGHVFGSLGLIVLGVALLMWSIRPVLNRYLKA